MAEDVRCRINYIEPTNIEYDSYGAKAIVPSNELVLNPLEDYCIAIDLEVIIPKRDACSLAKENGDYIKMNYSSTNGTISFMHGTDGHLTTNFTDINTIDPTHNTTECLGIESIDIEYSAWQSPRITIKFVDVRGGSVLLPEEKAYQDGGVGGSVYRSLFTLPSPMFKLTVKGFYGKGVTYYLCEEGIDIELDSSSGNFNITAKFIGMLFRIYADFPMVYLCAAPFMAGGDEYWNSRVSDGTFVFKNKSGTETGMYKFPTLQTKIKDALNDPDRISAAARGEQYDADIKNKIDGLEALINTYPLRDWFEYDDGYYLATTSTTTNAKGIAQSIETYIDQVKSFDKTYETNYYEKFEKLNKYKKSSNIDEYQYVVSTDSKKEGKANRKYVKELEDKERLQGYVNSQISSNAAVIRLFAIKDTSLKDEREFIKNELKAKVKEAQKDREEAKKEFERLQNEAIEKALGFTPSIQNVYNLAFAHMDTFMTMFYAQMDTIKAQLNGGDRTKEAFDFDDCDVKISEGVKMPPYPAFYKNVEENGQTRRQLVWPEEIPGGSSMEEVNFVKNLLSATKLFTEQMVSGSTEDVSVTRSGGTETQNGNAPSTTVLDLIPVTLNDFARKDYAGNPYHWIKQADEGNQIVSSESFEDAVLGSFAIRALNYLSSNDGKKDATVFGKLEAVNFIREFGEDYFSDRFFDFIKRYADNQGEKGDTNRAIRRLTSKSDDIWNFGSGKVLESQNITRGLLNSDTKLSFGLGSKGLDGWFPVSKTSAIEMKNDYANGVTASNSSSYIREDWMEDSGRDTFFVYNSRDYINTIYKSIENINDVEKYKISSSELKEFKNNYDWKYDKDDVTFLNDCLANEKGRKISGKKIRDIINETAENKDSYWVVRPTMVNGDERSSLFEQDFYIGQNDIRSKAYLFLCGVPIKKSRTTSSTGIPEKCENGVDLKLQTLREGAFYWRELQMAKNGFDPIMTKFNGGSYVPADIDEAYIRKKDGTVAMIKTRLGSIVNNYEKVKPPKGCTESRKKVLAAEFEKWVNSEFKPVEKALSNTNNYDPKTKELKFALNENKDLSTEAVKINNFLISSFFDTEMSFDYYAGRDDDRKFSMSRKDLSSALRGFIETLELVYKDKAKSEREAVSYDAAVKRAEDPFNNDDIRLSTYKTLKNLYDKWLVAPFKGRVTWQYGHPQSDFNTFAYIDSFYHDIGRDLLVNITKVSEWLSSCMPTQNLQSSEGSMVYMGKSLIEYLTDIAQSVGGLLISFPQRIGGQSLGRMSEMFRALPFTSDWETDESSFVFIYSYKPSEHLGNGEYDDDGMDLECKQIKDLLADEGYQIPAFGVTYGKQNQSYFKNITLNTNTPAVTEASITATMAIAAKGSEGQRETSLFGQDLYRIKTSYSYQCDFDMMGCMQVVPLMYFQLNNVPFWRGGYIIYSVKHSLTAGDMTTHVTGQRLNRYAIPLTNGDIKTDNEPINGSSGNNEGGDVTASAPARGEGGVNNPSDTSANPNVKINDTIDYKESNVTKEKPIICLTPAHGPRTSKSAEWYWSSTLIDNYIIPKLKQLKFYDGTSYANNIQRCNKDGNHTAGGYSTIETQNIIKKNGSDKVISVVPHWNGDYADFFSVYTGWKGSGGTSRRDDSSKFADMFVDEAKKLINKYNSSSKLPKGSMRPVDDKYAVQKLYINTDTNTDGAPKLNCACVLTENWFTNYRSDGGKWWVGKKDSLSENWDKIRKKDANGKYVLMEAWLFDTEGMNAIADMHVEAIRRYIETLHS